MKKGLIITSALALLFGTAVAVGAQPKKIAKVEATNETLYFDVSSTTWWNDASAKTYAYCYKNTGSTAADRNADWPGVLMSKVDGTNYKYSATVDSEFTYVIFNRVNPSKTSEVWNRTSKDGGTPINLPADYAVKNQFNLTADGSDYNDGNYCGNWTLYTGVSVTIVLNGEAPQVVTVDKGTVPVVDLDYGESFSGWFSDSELTPGNEVTAINSSGMTIYGRTSDKATHRYTLDVSSVDILFTNPYFYAWDEGGHNADWPGQAVTDGKFTVPEGAQIIIVSFPEEEGRKQTIDISQPTSPVADETLVITDTVLEGKYDAYWQLDEEAPADGFYLVGTKNNYKFRNASYISEIAKDIDGNVGYLGGYVAEANEKVTIRKSFKNIPDWIGNDDPAEGSAEQKAYGYKEGDDFKFTVAGTYDIFVHEDGFYVAEHEANRIRIGVVSRLYKGNTLYSFENGPSQNSIAGAEFTPRNYEVAGHHLIGFYSDISCTTPFDDGTKLDYDTTIYAKFVKAGYYTISGAGEWKIVNAVAMNTEDIGVNNKAEAAITVSAVNETYSFVYYNEEGEMAGHAGLGASYDYVEDESDHIKFTKTGTYTVYWSKNDNKLYVNGGLQAFYSNFISSMAAVCNEQGEYATEEAYNAVKAAWLQQKAAYNALEDTDKNTIKKIGFNGGSTDPEADQSLKMVAKYHYIVSKYGTAEFTDFIWNQNLAANNSFSLPYERISTNNGDIITITIIAATIAAISVGVFFMLKRKHD